MMGMTKSVSVRPVARRANFHDARRHFEAGGEVLVSEYGAQECCVVTNVTVTHSQDTTTWEELAHTVREWRSRYPNQRFYIVERELAEGRSS